MQILYSLVVLPMLIESHLHADNIIDLELHLERHFARENSLSIDEWDSSLPTGTEIAEITRLVKELYDLTSYDDVTNSIFDRYSALKPYLQITVLDNVCVVHEKWVSSGRFVRNWGMLAIRTRNNTRSFVAMSALFDEMNRSPSILPNFRNEPHPCHVDVESMFSRLFVPPRAPTEIQREDTWLQPRGTGHGVNERNLHHSAPHFESDGDVCAQAAWLFENTHSRSLVLAGASRYAVKGPNNSPCQKKFRAADAAHNSQTMFHSINLAIVDLATADRKNAPEPVFIQWHGMAETSCQSSDVFISTGVKNCSLYDTNIPATLLMRSWNLLSNTQSAATPRENSKCSLTASTNLLGRYINRVPKPLVCNTEAQIENITGEFVHVEQKNTARGSLQLWKSAIETALNDNSSINNNNNNEL